MTEFQPFPKIPRLSREIVITEKIDGTNAQILITDDGQRALEPLARAVEVALLHHASRTVSVARRRAASRAVSTTASARAAAATS